jgi:hypothetical protein
MNQNDQHIPERRESPRIETDFEGRVSSEHNVRCRVVNISRSGARAVSTVPLPEFSEVEISLHLKFDDGIEELDCRAAVVRCDAREDGQYDVGLFFPALEPEQKALLLRIAETGNFTPVA